MGHSIRSRCRHEGPRVGQEDLRQVQGHPPQGGRPGDLRGKPASQAAPGLGAQARTRNKNQHGSHRRRRPSPRQAGGDLAPVHLRHRQEDRATTSVAKAKVDPTTRTKDLTEDQTRADPRDHRGRLQGRGRPPPRGHDEHQAARWTSAATAACGTARACRSAASAPTPTPAPARARSAGIVRAKAAAPHHRPGRNAASELTTRPPAWPKKSQPPRRSPRRRRRRRRHVRSRREGVKRKGKKNILNGVVHIQSHLQQHHHHHHRRLGERDLLVVAPARVASRARASRRRSPRRWRPATPRPRRWSTA